MIPQEVFEQTLLNFFAPARPFLEDPTVTEIMINGPFEILIERAGRIERTEARFSGEHALTSALRNLAQYVGRRLDTDCPILEARLPDGSRVEAVIPPVAPDGPNVSIRRFFRETLTVERLVQLGSLSAKAAELLQALVYCRQNIMIAGGTGSGKTSLLNALSGFIPDDNRIIVIEDARELQLLKPHVVQLEARPADAKGRGCITIRDLFRASLRMRPDRIVVGEIRAGEALDLVQAMISGHGGCLSTIHATYPIDTLNRLETLALMSDVDLPLAALRSQIASAIDIIVQTARQADGSRVITHITQVLGQTATGAFELEDLFVRNVTRRDGNGKMHSEFVPTGTIPRCRPTMEAMGIWQPSWVKK
jgi:pilus assembly protein CpaF